MEGVPSTSSKPVLLPPQKHLSLAPPRKLQLSPSAGSPKSPRHHVPAGTVPCTPKPSAEEVSSQAGAERAMHVLQQPELLGQAFRGGLRPISSWERRPRALGQPCFTEQPANPASLAGTLCLSSEPKQPFQEIQTGRASQRPNDTRAWLGHKRERGAQGSFPSHASPRSSSWRDEPERCGGEGGRWCPQMLWRRVRLRALHGTFAKQPAPAQEHPSPPISGSSGAETEAEIRSNRLCRRSDGRAAWCQPPPRLRSQ